MKNISKIVRIVTAVIALIGVILLVRVLMAGDDSESLNSSVSAFVGFSYWLLIITAIIAVVLSLIGLVKNPAALKKTILGVLILAVLLAISYFTASDEAVRDGFGDVIKNGEAGSVSKWVSTLITFSGILGLLSLLAIGFGFVRSLSK